jgi:hypothetical protein
LCAKYEKKSACPLFFPIEYKQANEFGELLLDHVFITVKDLDQSIAFYETVLKPLGIAHVVDYDGKDGPEGHPDLKGFGRDGRVFFWGRKKCHEPLLKLLLERW